jgi:hypothetical protein
LLLATFLSPSLGIGITSDIFHTVGEYALSNVALMIEVREGSIAGR